MRRTYGPALVLVALVIVLAVCIALVRRQAARDLHRWPQFAYFRCATCDGPASIDPHCPSMWGCRECGFVTYRLHRHFWRTWANDYATPQELHRAERQAGVWSSSDEWPSTPVKAWLDCY